MDTAVPLTGVHLALMRRAQIWRRFGTSRSDNVIAWAAYAGSIDDHQPRWLYGDPYLRLGIRMRVAPVHYRQGRSLIITDLRIQDPDIAITVAQVYATARWHELEARTAANNVIETARQVAGGPPPRRYRRRR